MKTLAMVAACSAAAILASVAWLGIISVRSAALEESPVFEVVEAQGRTIFSVAPQNVSLYNHEQDRVFALTAASGSGAMTAWSADKALQSSAGVFGVESGFFAFDKDRERVSVGRRDAGNYALRILSSTGATVVGIGESTEGAGTLVVNDGSGHQRASLLMSDGRPGFQEIGKIRRRYRSITRWQGLGVCRGRRTRTRHDAGGRDGSMVFAGTEAEGYGVVRAGPESFNPGLGLLGLPGSYIAGMPK